MEQRRSNYYNSSNHRGGYGKEDRIEEEEQKGVPVHSQVRKIKQESNKIMAWSPEMRPVLREITRQQISRSPLGLGGRPISVGDS
ncbi:hypothetical protein Tsubulata_038222 [Turnera subulata]|uniref:Uncharacterized protein n=1 Tax=Turnera subulata TaxID=218843 RepID=A0A9Q0GIG2_9ROSI|nr:hypothetical protein Tsubulata_038222 [Turnera subulata]